MKKNRLGLQGGDEEGRHAETLPLSLGPCRRAEETEAAMLLGSLSHRPSSLFRGGQEVGEPAR